MYLQINDKYRIAGDKRQWMIQTEKARKDKKTGESIKVWESDSFFISLESAVNYLAELSVRDSDATDIYGALSKVRVITKQLTDALSPSFTVESK